MNAPSKVARDGFVIQDFAGNEIGFVECEDDGKHQRELVLAGMLRNLRDGLVVSDTRWEDGEEEVTGS